MLNYFREKTIKFLRWTEKYFQTDMVYFAKGGFWLAVSQFFTSGFAFVLSIAFANLLSKELYGSYKFILSLAGMIVALSLSGMNVAVAKAVAKGFEGSYRQAVKVQLKWSWVQTLAAFCIGAYYFYMGNPIFGSALIWIGLLSPIMYSFNTCLAFANGKRDFQTVTLYNAISSGFSALAMIAALLATQNISLLVLTYFLTNAGILTILHFLTLKIFKPNAQISPDIIKDGLNLSAINIISIIASNLDKIIIFQLFGPAELAIYYFALSLPDQFRGLFKIIQAVALPKMAAADGPSLKNRLFGKLTTLMAFGLLLSAIYYFAAPYLYKLFFPQYLVSINFSRLFALSLIANVAIAPLMAFLQGQTQTKALYRQTTLISIFQIVALIVLTVPFGIFGAITSRVIASYFNLAILIYFAKKSII